jgi:hypothetical protein
LEATQSKLKITCPNCEEENIIKLSSEIKCKKCEKDLTKWRYSKITKKVLGAGTAFILGVAPAYEIGKHMHSEDRYPIATEYSIVHSCISSHSSPLQRVHIKNKKTICICALSKTMKKIDYDDFTKDQEKFLDIFEQKAAQCQ